MCLPSALFFYVSAPVEQQSLGTYLLSNGVPRLDQTGGDLHTFQSYTQSPRLSGSRDDVGIHLHSCSCAHVSLDLRSAQDGGSLVQTRPVATGNTGMHQPTVVGAGALGPHQLQHLSSEQAVWFTYALHPAAMGAGAGSFGTTGMARATPPSAMHPISRI